MGAKSYNPLLKSYPDSEKINAVSIGAETLYTRLIARSDDHAHYYADAPMVLGKLYTHRMCRGDVKVDDVAGWLEELAAVQLITFYCVAGRRYLEIVNCRKSLRNDVERDVQFPDPEPGTPGGDASDVEPGGAVTEAGRGRHGAVTEAGRDRNGFGTPTQPNPTQPIYASVPDAGVAKVEQATPPPLPGFDRFWAEYGGPRKRGQERCRTLWRKRRLEPHADDILAGLACFKASHDWTKDKGQFIPEPHKFLNDRYWENPPRAPGSNGPAASGQSITEVIIND